MSTTDLEKPTQEESVGPCLDSNNIPSDDVSPFGEAPDGGLRAWSVALGAAGTTFACLGFTNSYGVFQEYYATHLLPSYSADAIAWFGSLSVFLQFAFGAISGPLFDRFGAGWVIRPAAIVYIVAIMLLSLCTEYWHFMLCQGVLMGLAMSMLQFPAFAAVSQFFDKRRAAALGIAISGSSIGGIVFPIALSKMLNDSSLGFGWSVRIMGFVVTPIMLFASVSVKARLPPRKTNFFIPEAFRDRTYVLLVVALGLSMLGMSTPLFFLPTYAVSRGVDATLASYLVAILNGASTFGRVIPGIVADKYGKLNIFAAGGLATGVVVLCLNTVTSTAGLVVYSVAFGFSSGTIISGASAALTICTDDSRNMGTYLGMGMAVGSVAALIGPPINGVLVERYAGFLQVSIFSGVVCLAGAAVAFASKSFTKQGLFGRV
ncbi:major facilitator superfamily domain-containing protein [Podospora aff. communis PSN243]|uniref:Major facilitator superfamily domain-containing protein n=1 Tax=Podospora aff. communis PSN243 TaxID=3040156 RepID=A0AAV9GKA0_9PEZI|nr:major facilitator superfamily domain-containing protein [Podospora aff. communis PSN243]